MKYNFKPTTIKTGKINVYYSAYSWYNQINPVTIPECKTMINYTLNVKRNFFFLPLLITFILLFSLCATNKKDEKTAPAITKKAAPLIKTIGSEEELKTIIESSGDRLLVFDLYADWCMPCKVLSPLLEEIAKENKSRASFYKINIDNHKRIAAQFGVSGIPYVVFLKNQKTVHALTGIMPKEKYVQAINKFSGTGTSEEHSTISGEEQS